MVWAQVWVLGEMFQLMIWFKKYRPTLSYTTQSWLRKDKYNKKLLQYYVEIDDEDEDLDMEEEREKEEHQMDVGAQEKPNLMHRFLL